jgi:poly(hydroxyalkanoate) granule-associated protein
MKERVKDLQDEMKESANKIWMAGLGAMSMAGEEGSKFFSKLVEKGQEFEKRESESVNSIKQGVDKTRERAEEFWARIETSFNERVASALQRLGVPTRDEIGELTNRVDSLREAVEKLAKKHEAAAKSETSTKKKSS